MCRIIGDHTGGDRSVATEPSGDSDRNRQTEQAADGDKDDFVPYYMMDELYNATNSEKEKLTIEGGEHANSDLVNPKLYWSTVNSFLEKYIEN